MTLHQQIISDPAKARRELDPKWFVEENFHIYDKDNVKRLCVFNNIQQALYGDILKCWQENKPVRLVVLKARRFGISTEILSLALQTIIYAPGAEALIESHDLKSANYLFKILQTGYNNLDIPEKPRANKNANGELSFSYPHGGRITVETGRSKTSGRAFQLKVCHASEVAFWENPEEAMAGVGSALSITDRHSICILESTANGVGNYFYNRYMRARDDANDEYKAIFYPWYMFPQNQRDASQFDLACLTEREEQIMEAYKLTSAQIAWYHWVVPNLCETEDIRAQEYPSDDLEAFLVSGKCRFKQASLSRQIKSANDIVGRFEITKSNEVAGITKAKFLKDASGYLRIWEKPHPSSRYVIGVDASEGLGGDNDESAAVVLNADTSQQAAELSGHFDPDEELGQIILALGYMYNRAYLGVEINGPGISTISALLRNKYPTSRLYSEKKVGYDIKYGWRNTFLTREAGINRLASALDNDEITLKSGALLNQLRTFIGVKRNNSIKFQAQSGCHDDLVIAALIATMLLTKPEVMRMTNVKSIEQQQSDDEDEITSKPKLVWSSYRQ